MTNLNHNNFKCIINIVLGMMLIGLTSCAIGEKQSTGLVNASDIYPIVDDRIEMSMYITPPDNVIDIHTNEAILWLEEFTNIDLDLTVGPHNNSEGKVELMLAAGGELPDIIFTNDGITAEQLNIYGDKGLLVPLNDYIEEYAPNLIHAMEYNPLIEDQITMSDGNIYSFPKYNEEQHVLYSQRMWINQNWLDYVGLKAPDTVAELYEVLVAFRENDCNQNGLNDEIPFSGIKDKWRTDVFGFIMQPFVSVSEEQYLWMVLDESRSIVPTVMDDGFKDGLQFLHKLYSEDLLDSNIFQNTSEDMLNITSAEAGNSIGMIQAGGLAPIIDTENEGARDEFVALTPLKSIEENIRRTPYFRPDVKNVFSITSDCDNIEAAVRLGDLFMIDPFVEDRSNLEVGLNIWYGPNGWDVSEEGKVGLNNEEAWYEWKFVFGKETNINYANLSSLFSTTYKKAVLAQKNNDFDVEKILWDAAKELYEPYGVDNIIPLVVIPTENSREYNEIKNQLKVYMKENFIKFVVGDRNFDEWDMFLEELNNLGIEWYVGVTQKAYDQMYKKD